MTARAQPPDESALSQERYAAIRALLAEPATYPDRPGRVDIVETHISCVFLTDRFAYKLKKPVRFEFLDYTSPDARRQACAEEVRLNRRLAPHVYLGVLPITSDEQGRLSLAGQGTPVEWVVHMRRLATDQTLEALAGDPRLTTDRVDAVAALLADFYARATPLAGDPVAYRAEIEHHVRANLRDLAAAGAGGDAPLLHRTHARQLQCLLLDTEQFDARVAAGRIVDGHGDLRPEHVCLSDPVVIFDCIEFDARLRAVDVADELSFLEMECDRLGIGAIGARIMGTCLRRLHDDPPQRLLAFFKSYRACVRAKVAALRAAQLAGAERDAAAHSAGAYLRQADGYLAEHERPLLVVVSGLMGCGKSTLAAALTEHFAADVLSTDSLRRELFPPGGGAAYDDGVYTAANRRAVYDELLHRGRERLAAGQSVVLDGAFLSADLVRQAAALGQPLGARTLAVRCGCPEDVAVARIAARMRSGDALSEARPELFARQKSELEPLPADLAQCTLDTTADLAAQVAAVVARLRQLTAAPPEAQHSARPKAM